MPAGPSIGALLLGRVVRGMPAYTHACSRKGCGTSSNLCLGFAALRWVDHVRSECQQHQMQPFCLINIINLRTTSHGWHIPSSIRPIFTQDTISTEVPRRHQQPVERCLLLLITAKALNTPMSGTLHAPLQSGSLQPWCATTMLANSAQPLWHREALRGPFLTGHHISHIRVPVGLKQRVDGHDQHREEQQADKQDLQ